MRSHLAAFLLSFFKFILVPKNKLYYINILSSRKSLLDKTFIARLLQFFEQKAVEKLYSVEYLKILHTDWLIGYKANWVIAMRFQSSIGQSQKKRLSKDAKAGK